jgi:hypothetical protein
MELPASFLATYRAGEDQPERPSQWRLAARVAQRKLSQMASPSFAQLHLCRLVP